MVALSTQAGTIGTPAWASPEQLNGKHAGEPSDVWSFGVLMFECYTGAAQPYAGMRNTQVVAEVLAREGDQVEAGAALVRLEAEAEADAEVAA